MPRRRKRFAADRGAKATRFLWQWPSPRRIRPQRLATAFAAITPFGRRSSTPMKRPKAARRRMPGPPSHRSVNAASLPGRSSAAMGAIAARTDRAARRYFNRGFNAGQTLSSIRGCAASVGWMRSP